jgi:hypothetical protein
MEKTPISFSLMSNMVKNLRPKKLYDLSNIKNAKMRMLTKYYRTAFTNPDELLRMFKNYVHDLLMGQIHGYDEGTLISNVIDLISKVKRARIAFLADYREHYDKFREFKEWLTPFEANNTAVEVLTDIIIMLINEYDAARETIRQQTGIEIPRNQNLGEGLSFL